MTEKLPARLTLVFVPIAPDSVDSLYRDIPGNIREIAEREGEGRIIQQKELGIEPRADLAGPEVAALALTIVTPIALELVKRYILPHLEGEYEVKMGWKWNVEVKKKTD